MWERNSAYNFPRYLVIALFPALRFVQKWTLVDTSQRWIILGSTWSFFWTWGGWWKSLLQRKPLAMGHIYLSLLVLGASTLTQGVSWQNFSLSQRSSAGFLALWWEDCSQDACTFVIWSISDGGSAFTLIRFWKYNCKFLGLFLATHSFSLLCSHLTLLNFLGK